MDIKEYIASGIIDSYVLGAVSDQERQEVQCMSKIYPEIQEELRLAEKAMESYASSIATTPPEHIKASILDKIKNVPQEEITPIVTLEAQKQSEQSSADTAIIRTLPNAYKWGAAASILVIIALTFMYQGEASEANNLSNKLATVEKDLESNKQSMQNRLTQLQLAMNDFESREAFINDPNTQKLILGGTETQPDANATIYYDQENGNAILASNGLPSPENGKQFQLWAIADGVPVDLGVLDKDQLFSGEIDVNLSNIQAFAITLEPNGGSRVPTLEQMYVVGSV